MIPILAEDRTVPPKEIKQDKSTVKSKMKYKLSMKNKYMKIKSYAGIKKDTGNKQTSHQDEVKKTKSVSQDDRSVRIINISTTSTSNTVVVEICAGKTNTYNSEIHLESDRDALDMKVWGLIKAKTCKTNNFAIFANNPSTITATFTVR